MWRWLPSVRVERLALLLLGACRFGGTSAIAPEVDASVSPAILEPAQDASVMAPAQDAGMAAMPFLDAGEDDAGCEPSCAPPEITVPSDCSRLEREGHVYLFCASKLTWADARSTCQGAGTDLVIVDDETENTFVAENLAATSWIGASDQRTEGDFVWIEPGGGENGAALTYTKWELATPDNCLGGFVQQDCARISKNGAWNDSACNGGCTESTFAFVCESY